jgi:hypothetical protein
VMPVTALREALCTKHGMIWATFANRQSLQKLS